MKKLLLATAALLCACALTVQAQDAKPKHAKMTDEQKAVMKAMLAKYDTNKDGKLDKTEKAAMSQEDKDKMVAAGLGPKKKGATETPAATPAPATSK